MVPGSMLMYGSNFCMVTRRPRNFRSRPSDEAVKPLPKELATPPVTKMCFGILTSRLVKPTTGEHLTTIHDPRMHCRRAEGVKIEILLATRSKSVK